MGDKTDANNGPELTTNNYAIKSKIISFLPAHSIFDGWLLSDGRRHPRDLLRGMENLTVGRYYGIFVMLFFMENTTLSKS